MIVRIPTTDRMIFVSDHVGDIVIDLSEYPEVDESQQYYDVPRIGNWTDANNGDGIISAQAVNNQGLQRDMGIWLDSAGEVSYNELNDRGNRISTTRQVKVEVTIQT